MLRNLVIVVLILSLTLVGCSNSIDKQLVEYHSLESEKSDVAPNDSKNANVEDLTIWSTDNTYEYAMEKFNEVYPNIKVNIVKIEEKELVDKYQNSLINQDTPDIFVIPKNNLGSFTGINGLENLLEEQYYDKHFFDKFPNGIMEEYLSMDGNKMYSLPSWVFPSVTYYRADILEQEGLPSDPVQLASYMEDEDNWMDMANQLKGNGYYIMEYSHSLLTHFDSSSNYFDGDLNYFRDQGPDKKLLNSLETIVQNELYLGNTIWSNEGRQALENGELIMVYQPSYGHDMLKEWLPNQTGKWRATKLPFGKVGIDNTSSVSLAISSYSDNKEHAWEFIKLAADDMLNMYKNEDKDDYYGGQDLNVLNRELLSIDLPGVPTPLDNSASEVWDLYLHKINSGQIFNKNELSKIEEDVNERIRLSKRSLLNFLEEVE